MMFGGELFFAAGLGFVILGPKRMHDLLGRVARARTELKRLQNDLAGQLRTEVQDLGKGNPPNESSEESQLRPKSDAEQLGSPIY